MNENRRHRQFVKTKDEIRGLFGWNRQIAFPPEKGREMMVKFPTGGIVVKKERYGIQTLRMRIWEHFGKKHNLWKTK